MTRDEIVERATQALARRFGMPSAVTEHWHSAEKAKTVEDMRRCERGDLVTVTDVETGSWVKFFVHRANKRGRVVEDHDAA